MRILPSTLIVESDSIGLEDERPLGASRRSGLSWPALERSPPALGRYFVSTSRPSYRLEAAPETAPKSATGEVWLRGSRARDLRDVERFQNSPEQRDGGGVVARHERGDLADAGRSRVREQVFGERRSDTALLVVAGNLEGDLRALASRTRRAIATASGSPST